MVAVAATREIVGVSDCLHINGLIGAFIHIRSDVVGIPIQTALVDRYFDLSS